PCRGSVKTGLPASFQWSLLSSPTTRNCALARWKGLSVLPWLRRAQKSLYLVAWKVSSCEPPHRRRRVSICSALLSRLARRRPHALQSIHLGRLDLGAHHEPRLMRGPRPATMHRGAVVPHDDVAVAPGVDIALPQRGCRGG